ncbi:Alpha-agarase [Frankliniella fusca]|uniref:Alpha-agarase n=1 Tax=Frankliniella fusca TaxID=407009 RepID=A0AAE1L9C2_9NEOP|nr:Alpha-agarase [Frankliniella fusca]
MTGMQLAGMAKQRKSKQDRTVRGTEGTDDLISGMLDKATAMAMQVGLEMAAEVGSQLDDNAGTSVNVDGDDNTETGVILIDNKNSKVDDTQNDNKTSKADDTQNDKAANKKPNERVSSSQRTTNDVDKLWDTGNSLDSENMEVELVAKPSESDPFEVDMSDDDENLLKGKNINQSPPMSLPNKEYSKIEVQQGTQPPKHQDQMQKSADFKTSNEEFELTGDEKKDSRTLMTIIKKMLTQQHDIAVEIKSVHQKLTKIFQHICSSRPSTSASTSTFVPSNFDDSDSENIPGHVCFGEGLYLDSKLPCKAFDITAGLFIFSSPVPCHVSEVLNDVNREKSFNALLQEEKKVLRAMKPDQMKEKLEEIRKLSDMHCVDLTESEVRAKLSHTLYEVRTLAAKKKEAAEGKPKKATENTPA